MSKHWPPNNVARFDFRRRLRRRSRGNRWAPAVLLAGAALVGAGVGICESLLSNAAAVEVGAPIEWNTIQAAPSVEMTADDEAWEQRAIAANEEGEQRGLQPAGNDPSTSQRASAIRASFSFCHTGGGTNCVVDGDTIWLRGERIRIADIDAPETHPPNCAEEAELGNRATRRLAQLLNGGAISLQRVDRDTDKYGRKLRVVMVDGRSVGDMLVGEGLARHYEGGRRPWC